jgi:uncharacterized repeat protein (TIGR01451 family)
MRAVVKKGAMKHRTARALLAAASVGLAGEAPAIGTIAATQIDSQAQIEFMWAGVSHVRLSNVASLRVVELVDVDLLLQTPERRVRSGASASPLVFRLSNTGNGTEAFGLAVIAGFDAPPAALYFDHDRSGTLSAADERHIAGANDPVLAADESVDLLLVQDIPAGLPEGQRLSTTLRAAASTGSGAPGTLYGSRGDQGVDALLGTSGGEARSAAVYVVGTTPLAVRKSAAIEDGAGGSRPVPGATIRYTITVDALTNARGALVRDAIPERTTYVGGSLWLDGRPLTDASDGDAGELGAAELSVALGDLAAGASRQVQFAVTID